MLVRQSGVLPVRPMYCVVLTALNVVASISAQRDLNSARVMSLVQHFAVAPLPVAGSYGVNGSEHLAASSGRERISVV
jgi:hypothetical protein